MSLKQSRVVPRDGKEKEKKNQKDSYLMFLWKGTPLPLTPSTLLRTDKVKLNFRLYFICLLCLFFFLWFYAFSLFLYTILCIKYCYNGLNKQSSGVRERIIHFTLILMGKWFPFSNKLVFEQPLGTNYVRQARFHRIKNWWPVEDFEVERGKESLNLLSSKN
jgi:hypothetical protein